MDSKLLLVKCITLLYRESESGQSTNSIDLCKTVIEHIKIPESTMDIQSGREVIVGLRATLLWMIDSLNKEFDKTQLLQRVRINTKDDTYLYNAVVDGLHPIENEDEVKKQILGYRKSLKDFLSSQSINQMLSQAFQKITFSGSNVDYTDLVRDLHAKLEPFTHDVVDTKHPAIVDKVNFDNEEEIQLYLQRSKEELSSEGVLKTGYQAINRMLGDSGGFRRGEFILVGALQHNFKTGFTMNLFKHAALYNTPLMRDPKKKPLLINFSLENELTINIMWLYANLMENETGEPCDITTVDIAEASKYIKERLMVNGYHIEMLRVEPGKCTYHDFFDIITKYESEGYEIHLIVCDYLNMMDKKGLTGGGPAGSEIRELFRRVRNFCAPRGITFVTPHQLSTEAKMLVRQGVDNFVQEIANKGYYDSCRTIDQEVDLEILIHIEKIKGVGSFLTIQRGKHRKISITPADDLYTVLPFKPVGGVIDDIDADDSSMKSPGGNSMAAGGEEWFDL